MCNTQPDENSELMQAIYFQNLGFAEFQNVCVQCYMNSAHRSHFPKCDTTDLGDTREEGRSKLTSESEK